jgi:hypothetical protein
MPKAKKLRVKPEKVQEVYQKILEELASKRAVGIEKIDLHAMALAVGYKNPRSDAVFEAMKLLKKDGLMNKNKVECWLTDKGVEEKVTEEEVPEDPDAVLEHYWNALDSQLATNKKAGKTAREKAKDLWDLLSDGKVHNEAAVFRVTGYSVWNTTGLEQIMKHMKQLELVTKDKKKSLQLTDKVFPFGRPE